jgi:ElaB/YqjD/DUF883 family membrane-anchored ribosome-binding protein
MGEDPSAIREQVEQTRERLGETVDALAYKADVPSRTKEAMSDKMSSLKEKVTGAAGTVNEKVSGAAGTVNESTPSTTDVKQGARKAKGIAQDNPLGLAVGAAAVGFLGGLLIPSTRVEHEKLGPASDELKQQVKETAQTVVEHGREAAQDAAQAATQAVKETGAEHAQQAKSDVADQAQQARESVGGAVSS